MLNGIRLQRRNFTHLVKENTEILVYLTYSGALFARSRRYSRGDNKSDDIQSRGIGTTAHVANKAVAQSRIAADIFEKHNLLRLRQYTAARRGAARRGNK